MAERNEQVMDLVRRELERDPGIGLDALFDMAKEIDPAVAEMSQRQFHARYPLQVKRGRGKGEPKPAAAKKRRTKPARGEEQPAASRSRASARGAAQEQTGGDRDAIRSVFMEFASDFAQAESRQEIVRVLSSIDGYVDRVHQMVKGK